MPSVGRPQPNPPTPRQAAQLLNLVWEEDKEFGLYLWTSFTTGGRRGELVGPRESRFDFDLQEVRFATNYIVKRSQRIEKTPKDGEGRRVSLDPLTCELNRGYFRRRPEHRRRTTRPRRRLHHLKFYAQFSRPADQRAATVIPSPARWAPQERTAPPVRLLTRLQVCRQMLGVNS
jgi:hypothetical protein